MELLTKNGAAHPQPNTEPLVFKIENKPYSTNQQYYYGIELKQLASIPDDVPLYLSIEAPYEHELIENNARVNIARPSVEHFFVRDEDKLPLFINGNPFVSYKQFISGAELRLLGSIPTTEALFLDLPGKWKDDLITEDEVVDLAREGSERFVSRLIEISYTIYVNTREVTWNKVTISYEELINLSAYAGQTNSAITVTYSGDCESDQDGVLSKGTSVNVKQNMSFNVTPTFNS